MERLLAKQGRLVSELARRMAQGERVEEEVLLRLLARQEEARLQVAALGAGAPPTPKVPPAPKAPPGEDPLRALRNKNEPVPGRRAHAPLPRAQGAAVAPPSLVRTYGSIVASLDENTLAALEEEAEANRSDAARAGAEPELPLDPAYDEGEEYTPVPAPPGPPRERLPRFSDPDYPYPILQTAALCGDGDLASFGLLGLRYRRWEPLALSYAAPFALGFFGVPGSGKSYALGAVVEGALQEIRCLNRLRQPLCALSLHYHPGASYAPELLASVHENPADQDAQVLSYVYRALPEGLHDVVILTLPERVAEMRKANPHAQVHPLRFALRELSIDGLRILLGLTADPAPEYAQRVEARLREREGELTWNRLLDAVCRLGLEPRARRLLAARLARMRPWVDDRYQLCDFIRPGRLIQLDLRGDTVPREQAMTLFALSVHGLALRAERRAGGAPPLLVAYDEAHKFARVPLLRQQMETLVRERRHLGVSVLLSSQDPPSLPGEVLSLLDGVGVFRHESSAWARHLGKSCAAFARLPVSATARLPPGLMWFWARRWQVIRPEWEMPEGPILIATRPRASAHRG